MILSNSSVESAFDSPASLQLWYRLLRPNRQWGGGGIDCEIGTARLRPGGWRTGGGEQAVMAQQTMVDGGRVRPPPGGCGEEAMN